MLLICGVVGNLEDVRCLVFMGLSQAAWLFESHVSEKKGSTDRAEEESRSSFQTSEVPSVKNGKAGVSW